MRVDDNNLHRLGRTHEESEPHYDLRPVPAEGSPNVIYVVLDDVGYSDLGCYGSNIATPHFDALADNGLRYSNFHTTTLCSPTRACLLTGRNHHSVGMRFLANADLGWPSGRGEITHRAATLAEVLKAEGYATLAIGKWHLAPTDCASAAGPFDQWPLGRGFERFYGFMNGGTDQFNPELFQDNHVVHPPKTPEEGYHLTEDLVDNAISSLSDFISLFPEKPFFLHLCFGAGHFPHQAPKEYIDRYKGKFAHGWDEERARRLARQKELGLVPENVELPPSNPGVEKWDDLSAEARAVSERLQEAYAGFLEHTDAEFGRFMAFLERVGKKDNTLIVLLSDNGASVDCGPEGTVNILRWFNQLPESSRQNLEAIDRIGTPKSFTNYPWGWAQASNTPVRLYKSFTHGGGVRDPMIVSWPERIKAAGEVRHQFNHVIDIMPTILDVCGFEAPDTLKGVPQMPIHGVSFAATFDDDAAETKKDTQYFEMYGHRSIWHKGWKAVTKHTRGDSFETERWELYNLEEDFAECHDLAEAEPVKLQELKERWWAEAGKYGVEPLDDRDILLQARPRPDSPRLRKTFRYLPPVSRIPGEAAPLTQDTSHRIDADVFRTDPAQGGTILTFGNYHGGYGLFVHDNRLVFVYNFVSEEVTHMTSEIEVPLGEQRLSFVFEKTGALQGTGRLFIGPTQVAEHYFDRMLRMVSLAPLSIGAANKPPISPLLQGDSPFQGELRQVLYSLGDDRHFVPETLDVD